ncbi:hypothetical protein [Rubrivirga litoralis]|uniref:Flagellar protein FlgJ N-terminal domain-containing protein n=1 Tax=Rubrivirga litoralis TaxID=3075598 RepID=A0ABU3BR60_9BACT|nr:hypothetical protein [Rubrivirga sp. F394]MDT0631773.1 hypothetical protein [Rubrivirga sp. F394]
MTLSTPPGAAPLSPTPPGTPRKPGTPEEAAEQFEAVLVRQFVAAMTDGLFKNASGGAGATQADAQRDAMTTALTDQLVESGSLRFRDLLLRQWGKDGGGAAGAEGGAAAGAEATGGATETGPAPPRSGRAQPAHVEPPRPVQASGDAHFDLLRRAAALGKSSGRL